MFRTVVDQLVKITLTNEPVKCEWVCGSLFVSDITAAQAQAVKTVLEQRTGPVICSQIGKTSEFAYDFI